MKELGLVSTYTVAQFKPHTKSSNESDLKNELKNSEFDQEEEMTAIVSDLTYVRVNQKWHYVCVFVDLFNREIVGYSIGPNKDALLVYRALASNKLDLHKIQLFHTERGNEFKNKLIDDALETFNIQRSLSMKGCPYDNAVAEATFKIIKPEFVKGRNFDSLEELTRELHDYVHWFNHLGINGTLGYVSPIDYKLEHLKKLPSLVLTIQKQRVTIITIDTKTSETDFRKEFLENCLTKDLQVEPLDLEQWTKNMILSLMEITDIVLSSNCEG